MNNESNLPKDGSELNEPAPLTITAEPETEVAKTDEDLKTEAFEDPPVKAKEASKEAEYTLGTYKNLTHATRFKIDGIERPLYVVLSLVTLLTRSVLSWTRPVHLSLYLLWGLLLSLMVLKPCSG